MCFVPKPPTAIQPTTDHLASLALIAGWEPERIGIGFDDESKMKPVVKAGRAAIISAVKDALGKPGEGNWVLTTGPTGSEALWLNPTVKCSLPEGETDISITAGIASNGTLRMSIYAHTLPSARGEHVYRR